MWIATITKKDFENGLLRVIVSFSNGVSSFEEEFHLRRGPELDSGIKKRLQDLQSLEIFSSNLQIGGYEPSVSVEATPTPLQIALSNLSKLRTLVESGVLSETDTEYVDALNLAKLAYQNK